MTPEDLEKMKKLEAAATPGTEELTPARDTTFDGIEPKHLWVNVSNCNDTRELEVSFELNGIKETIFKMKPNYIEDRNVLHSRNLTWIFDRFHKNSVLQFENNNERIDTIEKLAEQNRILQVCVEYLSHYNRRDVSGPCLKALAQVEKLK